MATQDAKSDPPSSPSLSASLANIPPSTNASLTGLPMPSMSKLDIAVLPPKEDRFAAMIHRNRAAKLSLGLVGIGGGATCLLFGFFPPVGWIAGGLLIAVGVFTLAR